MPSLLELQEGFRHAIFAGKAAEDVFLPWLVEPPATGRQRLASYRRSILSRLIDALEATYPVVSELVGRPFLREAARQYALAHPSTSGNLDDYGEGFADYLAAYPHAAALPYLADVARLEWLVQAVAAGPDEPAPLLERLATVPPEDWPRLVFTLSRSRARLDSAWPVGAIWRRHQPGGAGEDTARRQPCRALVWREGARLRVEDLSPGEAALFDALAAGDTLASALANASPQKAGFDAQAALGRLAATGLLLSARLAQEKMT